MFEITKEIGIDAAHRVQLHHSKCRNLHGHRYTIQASLRSESLHDSGSQTGMVMDFGFLKELMMELIDARCDHGTIVCIDDADLVAMLRTATGPSVDEIRKAVDFYGSYYSAEGRFGKTLYVPFAPTAENLAKLWYDALSERVFLREGRARVSRIRVWETPSSCADYPAL